MMDGSPISNRRQVGSAHEDSSAADDSEFDLYNQSPEKNREDGNGTIQPSAPTAKTDLTTSATTASLTGIASPDGNQTDNSSFDDVYGDMSIPADANNAADPPQGHPHQQSKPNGSAASDSVDKDSKDLSAGTHEDIENVPKAGGDDSQEPINMAGERQALSGAGDIMPGVSSLHSSSVLPGDMAIDSVLSGSSPAQSSTSSDSSETTSSEEDEEDSDDDVALLDPAEQAKLLMAEAIEQVDGEAPRTANEQVAQFTKPDIIVTPDMSIIELGAVEKMVELQALIRAKTSGQYRVLEVGSVLCLQDRTVIGSVFDIVGRVHEPAYTVGFTSEQDLKDSGVAVGTVVYYVEAHSTYVFTQPLQLSRGTDASNMHDEEVAVDEVEFSDDELEAAHKRSLKQARRSQAQGTSTVNEADPSSPPGRSSRFRRGGGGKHKRQRLDSSRRNAPPRDSAPVDSTVINYDDDNADDVVIPEGYQPLRRPDNLTDLMQRGPQHGMTRRQRGRRDRRDMFRRGPNRPNRFERDNHGSQGYGHAESAEIERRNSREGRNGRRRAQRNQGAENLRSGASGYGIDSTADPTYRPYSPSSPIDAQSAAQGDPAAVFARHQHGQHSSYSPSRSTTQVRPYVPDGQYAQTYPFSHNSGHTQQPYYETSRSTHGSVGQYNAPMWHQNPAPAAAEEEYTPSFNLEPHSIQQLGRTLAGSIPNIASTIQSPQQFASALQASAALLSPASVNIFGAPQQSAAAFNSLQQPQPGGNRTTDSQDIGSILERFKAHGQRFRDAYP